MSDSHIQETEPHTPPRTQSRHDEDEDGLATPTFSSPPASPSVSLRSLRMFPLSPLQRRFSASYARSSQSPRSDADGVNHREIDADSRDVLVQRLSDLAVRLNSDDEVQGNSLNAMHAQVDDLEAVLSRDSRSSTGRHRRNHSFISQDGHDHDVFSATLGHTWLNLHPPNKISTNTTSAAPLRPEEISQSTKADSQGSAVPDSRRVEHILNEAKNLQETLESVIGSLKARQEEQEVMWTDLPAPSPCMSDHRQHIHDLLITRAERAAQRIIYLEGRVQELENERNEGEMDILNLQIQMKAIEVQCLGHLPKDADPELLNSIETWKAEWSAVKRKRARKKGEELAALSSPTPRSSRHTVLRSHTAG
ncbi:hypothetical protein JX265_005025 [Neoarthrinium moseri]|uniref:Uncharacterized protein n=1 Tax=Neoarthrinium moseri TaxID=1658444 RepID=A0A9P9WPG5_9PEZI|nr:hypothetical protein JX265_005025 [Neoarthrinium moseri]